MNSSEFFSRLNQEFPSELALEDDEVGLQIESDLLEVKKVLCVLEITLENIEEAKRKGIDLIITFHPFIYKPFKKITNSSSSSILIKMLIKYDISVFVIHTNFDTHIDGTNQTFIDALDLEFSKHLIELENQKNGFGIVAVPKQKITFLDLVQKVNEVCNCKSKFANNNENFIVKKVAVICGSGTSFTELVKKHNVDVFITSDIKYHKFFELKEDFAVIDPGHYEMEQFVPSKMKKILESIFPEMIGNIFASEILTNPVQMDRDLREKQRNYLLF